MTRITKFSSFASPVAVLTALCCYANNYVVEAESETESVVFYCCPIQNAFNGVSCDDKCIAANSLTEFDTDLQQARWSVPEKFRLNQSQFNLRFETRNISVESCEAFRVNVKHKTLSSSQDTSDNNNVGTTQSPNKDDKTTPSVAFLINGSIVYKDMLYNPSEYCFDRLSEGSEYTMLDLVVLGEDNSYCNQAHKISLSVRQPPYHEKWINQLFAAMSGFSCLFTIINVIIYLSLRKYLNVSGWVEFTYFLALGIFCAFSIPAFLHEPTSHNDTFCYITSAVLQFSEIMVYSSYIMIAVDAYWMLRKSDTFAAYGEEIEESRIRLMIYLLALLAVPTGVTVYGLVLNQGSVLTEHKVSTTIPYYGKKSCFAPEWDLSEYLAFGVDSATLFIILLSVNHIFGRLSASTDVDDAPRVSLLSNMFFFTLCYWITNLLKFAKPLLLSSHSNKESGSDNFWIVLDGFTYAQGMLSFVVFIFNRKTLKAFKRKAGGTNGTLRVIFRHACCSNGSRVDASEDYGTPMSPLMKSSSMRRSTVRQNHLY